MKINFSQAELAAIQELSEHQDISPEKIVIQAVRLYQLRTLHLEMEIPESHGCSAGGDEDIEDRPGLRVPHVQFLNEGPSPIGCICLACVRKRLETKGK